MRTCRRPWLWVFIFVVYSLALSTVTALPRLIKIGGLFDTNDDHQVLAFHRIIKLINTDQSMVPPNTQLVPVVRRIAPQDSFKAYKEACDFLRGKDDGIGIAAIIAPKSPSNLAVAQSISDKFSIPLLQTHWAPRTKYFNHTVNVFPDSKILASAFSQYITAHNWKSFALIFEDNEALIRHQDVLQVTSTTGSGKMKVTLRHLQPEEDLKKLMKDFAKAKIYHFVVDLPLHRTKQLFAAARNVSMMEIYQSYVLTSLDVSTVDWAAEKYVGSPNITSFRLINEESYLYRKLINDWKLEEQNDEYPGFRNTPITAESAVLLDALVLFTKTLNKLNSASPIELFPQSCDAHGQNVWREGTSIVNHMKITPLSGSSGLIQINPEDGLRSTFSLDVIKVTLKGIIKTESWDTARGFIKMESEAEMTATKDLLKNRTLRVTIGYASPYVSLKENSTEYKGNEQFEGYCVELLNKLSSMYGFNYTMAEAKDKKYGDDKSGEWNGMIGELLRREADIAITDLSIIYRRESVVDFTLPFMNLGISILFKKPEKTPPPMFSFLKPLSLEVWFYMGTGYLGVSLFLFILARLSPYEWVNPHPCDEDNDTVENQFTLLNSFWFTMGSIMQQGSDILPRAVSTRIVASSWWFFTLIMISSYTANLAAFLTAQRMKSPIESAEDLAKQTTIKYGCKEGGSTQTFFKESKYPVYQRMWSFMEAERPTVFTQSNDEGIERVKMGNYAFLMESSSIEYVTERNCELTKIGGNLDSKGYGIATPPDSPIRSILSAGILDLQESQYLQILKDKYWKPDIRCPDDSGADSAEMGIRNVGGVFMVLGIGSCFSIVIVVMEFVWKAKKMLDRDPIPVMFWRELKSTLTCRGSTRPAPKEEEEPSMDKMPMVNMNKTENYSFT